MPFHSETENALTDPAPLPPKYRILIVDDYADAALSLMMLLKMEGHEVETADCGMQAIERVKVFQPHVVLLDIGLPDLDGYEVARRLRESPETRGMVLVALTGYGLTEELERAKEAGFDYHILKPLKFQNILALLASLQDPAPRAFLSFD